MCHKLYQISLVIPLVVLRSSRDPEVRHNLYLGPDSAGESPGVLRFRALLAAQAVSHKLYLGQISFVNPPGVPAEFPCNDLGAREAKRRPCTMAKSHGEPLSWLEKGSAEWAEPFKSRRSSAGAVSRALPKAKSYFNIFVERSSREIPNLVNNIGPKTQRFFE